MFIEIHFIFKFELSAVKVCIHFLGDTLYVAILLMSTNVHEIIVRIDFGLTSNMSRWICKYGICE